MLLAQQEERLRAEFKLQLQQAEFEMDGLKGLLELKDARGGKATEGWVNSNKQRFLNSCVR